MVFQLLRFLLLDDASGHFIAESSLSRLFVCGELERDYIGEHKLLCVFEEVTDVDRVILFINFCYYNLDDFFL